MYRNCNQHPLPASTVSVTVNICDSGEHYDQPWPEEYEESYNEESYYEPYGTDFGDDDYANDDITYSHHDVYDYQDDADDYSYNGRYPIPNEAHSSSSTNLSDNNKIYLFRCPFEEKEDVKKAGAKWDPCVAKWYIERQNKINLEPFNRWHPNGRKYLVCSYQEKDEAKKAGARWDASNKQWYFDANDVRTEHLMARWLPSTNMGAKPKKRRSNADQEANVRPNKRRKLAIIPRINPDMTVVQLRNECLARGPSTRGLSTKSKSWLSQHLRIGTPWISVQSATTMPNSGHGGAGKLDI